MIFAPPDFVDAMQRYSINEASAILRQSRQTTYEDIKKRRLQIIKEGSRTFVPGSELIRRAQLPHGRVAAGS